MRKIGLTAIGAALFASSALAASPVTIYGPDGTKASVTAAGVAVSASNLPATVDTNAGAAGASTIRTVLATGGAGISVQGSAGTVLTQGTGAAGANSLNMAIGAPLGSLAPASAVAVAADTTTATNLATLVTNTGAATSVPTTALASGLVVLASAGSLKSFTVSADSTLYAAAWYVMIFNSTTVPGDGAVTPIKCYAMPAGAPNVSGSFPNPIAFSTGIAISVGTTGCFTKTASTHALFIGGDY